MIKNKLFRKRKGSLLWELCIYGVLLTILIATLNPASGTTVRTAADDVLKDQTLIIDNALSLWQASHDSKYPSTLTVLQDMAIISAAINLSQFSYSLQNNQTEYQLTIHLRNGSTYKSSGSKF
jgi:hypothetical protein